MLHIKLNGITKCSNIVANSLPADLHPDPRASKGKKSTLSKHGHVVHQIKGNHECSIISQIFCVQPAPTP